MYRSMMADRSNRIGNEIDKLMPSNETNMTPTQIENALDLIETTAADYYRIGKAINQDFVHVVFISAETYGKLTETGKTKYRIV